MSDEDDVTTEAGGVEVNWTHFLTGSDDATINGVSFLSSPKEWHALALGAFFGAVAVLTGRTEILYVLATYALGRETKRLAEHGSGHLRDAVEEPVYTAIGVAIGAAVGTLAAPLF